MNCSLSETSITVGQKINLACRLDEPVATDAKVSFTNIDSNPAYTLQFLGPAHIGGQILTQEVTSYRVGNHELKQIKLVLNGRETPLTPLSIHVSSVIQTEQQQPTPFPIVDPIEVPAPWWWWAIWIVVGLTAIGFIIYRTKKWLKERNALAKLQEESRPLTPDEKFKSRMRKLESQGYHQRGEYKTFALELTNILKTSIGEQLHIQAEELTSEELMLILQERYRKFYQDAGSSLRTVLYELDQIKFAKIETTSEHCSKLLDESTKIGAILFGEIIR